VAKLKIPQEVAELIPKKVEAETPIVVKKQTSKAYEILSDQPISLRDLSSEDRGNVVISAILDDSGNTVVLSRVKDLNWQIWPFTNVASRNHRSLNWTDFPEGYREICQNIFYFYWKVGRSGWSPPEISSLSSTLVGMRIICRFAERYQLETFADMKPLHISTFVNEQIQSGFSRSYLTKILLTMELLYVNRSQQFGSLQFYPWPDSSALLIAGGTGKKAQEMRKIGLTPLIPAPVAQKLFLYSENILKNADHILDQRDQGFVSADWGSELNEIRTACFYLMGVLTGMRNSELSSLAVEAGRKEIINGITFHWVTSIEYKTKKGLVEYLMPELGHNILKVMERWSKPYRDSLAKKISVIEAKDGERTAEEMEWLTKAHQNAKKLFLTEHGLISQFNMSRALKKFAIDAGTDWDLSSHQLRRLYAYTFVRHRLGDMLFLKEQFKHSSIDMSQLYCANPLQDPGIYEDILNELTIQKVGVIAQWLEKDEPLAGGAGQKIKEMRAHDFPGRKELLKETSLRVNMRSTGHSWCLATDEGCGSSGIYSRGNCGSCGDGLIDRRFIPVWQEAYRHNKELIAEAEQLGPGMVKRVQRDLAQAAKILKDLGEELDDENEES